MFQHSSRDRNKSTSFCKRAPVCGGVPLVFWANEQEHFPVSHHCSCFSWHQGHKAPLHHQYKTMQGVGVRWWVLLVSFHNTASVNDHQDEIHSSHQTTSRCFVSISKDFCSFLVFPVATMQVRKRLCVGYSQMQKLHFMMTSISLTKPHQCTLFPYLKAACMFGSASAVIVTEIADWWWLGVFHLWTPPPLLPCHPGNPFSLLMGNKMTCPLLNRQCQLACLPWPWPMDVARLCLLLWSSVRNASQTGDVCISSGNSPFSYHDN